MKILEIFGENRLEFIEKCRIIKIYGMISIWQLKLSNLLAKFCAIRPQMNNVLKIFKKIWRFFKSESLWKIDFFHKFLRNISWSSPPPDATDRPDYYLLKTEH